MTWPDLFDIVKARAAWRRERRRLVRERNAARKRVSTLESEVARLESDLEAERTRIRRLEVEVDAENEKRAAAEGNVSFLEQITERQRVQLEAEQAVTDRQKAHGVLPTQATAAPKPERRSR